MKTVGQLLFIDIAEVTVSSFPVGIGVNLQKVKQGFLLKGDIVDSTFIQEIPNGKRLVLTCFYMYVSTASDWARMELVTTGNADGSGVITVKSGQFRLDTGAAVAMTSPNLTHLDPPLIVTSNDGGALTAQVLTNDADAALTLMLHGWLEVDD